MAGPVVVKGVACVLAHVPGLVPFGSKPTRELARDGDALLETLRGHLRSYDAARAYAPNQAFIGNVRPQALFDLPQPWWLGDHLLADAPRSGPFGEIVPEEEFWGLVKLADDFDLVHLSEAAAGRAADRLRQHPLLSEAIDLSRIESGEPLAVVAEGAAQPGNLALRDAAGALVGYVTPGYAGDASQTPDILLENLAAKATGALALLHLLRQTGTSPKSVDYVLGCGEEAVGDRYQRGGGNLAKAMAELARLPNADGADVKAFCCAPVHATVIGGALVQADVHRGVVVVGGGSLAKLGMKFRGALAHEQPILEDTLAALAVQIGPDDGSGDPRLRLDVVGKHAVAVGGAPRALYESLVLQPLARAGLTIPEVDRYAVELHNPEITEAGGSGNVARTNYRTLASLAVLAGQLPRDAVDSFERTHGMPGYVPTQGHIPAALPYLAHARAEMRAGALRRALFVAKGSLFLGKMTNLADGMSILVEAA